MITGSSDLDLHRLGKLLLITSLKIDGLFNGGCEEGIDKCRFSDTRLA